MKSKRPKNPIKRARRDHRNFDLINREFRKESPHPISCEKGCSFCCHIHVDVNADEAVLLHRKVKELGLNTKRFKIQRRHSAETWMKMSFEDRKCVFLDNKGECMVYEDRPMSCRNYRVTTPKEDCDTREGVKKVGQVVYSMSEWVACVVTNLNNCQVETMAKAIMKLEGEPIGLLQRNSKNNEQLRPSFI